MRKVFSSSMFLLAMVASLVLMAMPGFSEEKESNPHARIAQEWRKSISDKAPALGSQEISRVVFCVDINYLANGMPRVESIEALENKKTSNLILFIPVLKGERELSKNWRDLSFLSPAQYVPAIKAIVVDGDVKYSQAGKIIALSREYYRAYALSNDLYTEEDYWLMEKDAQSFQNKVISFLGGEKYYEFVYAEARRINKKVNNKKTEKLGCFLPEPTAYNKQLIKIFGKPESREEEIYIQRILWIDAMFVIIENDTSIVEVGKQKADFLRSVNFYREKKPISKASYEDYNWHYLSRQK